MTYPCVILRYNEFHKHYYFNVYLKFKLNKTRYITKKADTEKSLVALMATIKHSS